MSTEKKQAELIKEISGVNPLKCMKCGKCSASCPSVTGCSQQTFVTVCLIQIDLCDDCFQRIGTLM